MFSKPQNGWSTVTLNDVVIGAASYIEDVATDTLTTLISYLKGELTHFELMYDGEGYDFGISQIFNELYAVSNKSEDLKILFKIDPNYEDSSTMETIRKLAKEIYEDFTKDFNEWLVFYIDNDCEEELIKYKIEFQKLLDELKTILEQPYHDIEMGNLIFGNSRGEFCVSRDKWEEYFLKFLTQCGFDSYGHINDEEIERLYCVTDYVPEQKILDDGTKYTEHIHLFSNDTFELRPYYWGDNEVLAKKPNFIYKPSNIEISWYKYPLRDAYSNKQLTLDELYTILKECAKSLNKTLHI